MSYTITYKEDTQKFEMDGVLSDFIWTHLEKIGKKENIFEISEAICEGQMLVILEDRGIIVNLLEEDGSRMEW